MAAQFFFFFSLVVKKTAINGRCDDYKNPTWRPSQTNVFSLPVAFSAIFLHLIKISKIKRQVKKGGKKSFQSHLTRFQRDIFVSFWPFVEDAKPDVCGWVRTTHEGVARQTRKVTSTSPTSFRFFFSRLFLCFSFGFSPFFLVLVDWESTLKFVPSLSTSRVVSAGRVHGRYTP